MFIDLLSVAIVALISVVLILRLGLRIKIELGFRVRFFLTSVCFKEGKCKVYIDRVCISLGYGLGGFDGDSMS